MDAIQLKPVQPKPVQSKPVQPTPIPQPIPQPTPIPQPIPQPFPTSILSVMNIMTRKKTAPSKVTAGNIQQYGKRACETVKSDPKDYYVINEDGHLVKISSLTCFSETINLFTIAKSVFSIPSLDCISVTPSGSFKGLFQSTVIPNMPHFTIDWKFNGKLNDKQIKQILSNRIFSSLKVIIVTDEMKDFQGYSSLSYIGSNGQIVVSSLSIPFHLLQLKGLHTLEPQFHGNPIQSKFQTLDLNILSNFYFSFVFLL